MNHALKHSLPSFTKTSLWCCCLPHRWLAVMILALGTSCTSWPWSSEAVLDPGAGVPLTSFKAKDQDYFPEFITAFFPGSVKFAESHATLKEASEHLKLIEVKRLTSAPTEFNEANLSWSADGVYLGYEIDTEGTKKIMLKDLIGGFSKDLFVTPSKPNNFLDGMVVKSAHSYNAGLRWSHDSTRFAFMSNGGIGEYNIYVGAIGAREMPVASGPTKDGYATWSPASNEIAFVSSRTGRGDIYLIELGEKSVSRLSFSDAVDIFPEWSPDGRSIVYSSGDALDHDLFVVRRAETGDTFAEPMALTKWPRDDLRPTVSPDGSLVAFYADSGTPPANGDRTWNIHVLPLSGNRTYTNKDMPSTIVARNVVIDLNTGPAWSPDSRKIFYVKHDSTGTNPIAGYDLYSGKNYILATNTRMNRDILMSPLGVLSFRAQVGVWDRVFVALTNQGVQLQTRKTSLDESIKYLAN